MGKYGADIYHIISASTYDYKYLDYNVHTRFFLLYTKDSLQGDELEN